MKNVLSVPCSVIRVVCRATSHHASRNTQHVVLLAVTLLLTVPLHAADFSAAFDAANKLYEQGKFAEAATAYQKLAASGPVSAALSFNLGNAHFKSGRLGSAIVAYRQSLELAPRDPDARANLQFARNKANGGQTTPPPIIRRALASLTLDEWTLLSTVCAWAWFALLALGEWRVAFKRPLRGWALTAGALAAVFTACLLAALVMGAHTREAVVVSSEVVVRYGPLEESKSFFTARDGAELRVLGEKDDWLQVADSAQRVGWLRRSQAIVFPGS